MLNGQKKQEFMNVALLAGILCVMVSGCAVFDNSRILLDVPFVSQDAGYCGVAALDMILRYYNADVDNVKLKDDIYIPAIGGTVPELIAEAATRHGVECRVEHIDLNLLKQYMHERIPPIVFLIAPGHAENYKGHFTVVTGIMKKDKFVRMHSGGNSNGWYRTEEFLKWWSAGGYTSIIAQKNSK